MRAMLESIISHCLRVLLSNVVVCMVMLINEKLSVFLANDANLVTHSKFIAKINNQIICNGW